MKLSTKGRYGLRAMVDLAIHSKDGPVSIHSIAVRQNISDRYLEQLMGKLKKAGYVTSVRGVQGGYQPAKEPGQISVGEILRALEGDLNPVDCGALNQEKSCANAQNCTTKYVWKKINDSVQNTVDQIYLNELMEIKEEDKEVQE